MKYVLLTLGSLIAGAVGVVLVMFHGRGNDVLMPGAQIMGSAPRPGAGTGGGGGGGD